MNKSHLIKSLRNKGFSDEIVRAFLKIKRENFIHKSLLESAYEDTALPIGYEQKISQPYTIALMLSELGLRPGQKVLEVGSGSGYVLALLSEISKGKGKIFGMEIIRELAEKSRKILADRKNIKIYNKSGFGGLFGEAPFDKVLVSAAVREIPKNLLNQLNPNGGIIVAPKGPVFEQSIVVIKRKGNNFKTKKEIPGFIFVPLVD